MDKINKELVKKRFKKSFLTYTKNATVQKSMSEKLISKLIELKGNSYKRILEFGCGTGFLTKNMTERFNFEDLFINDIVEESLDKVEKFSDKTKKIYGDCEYIDIPKDLNLIISNATFQWIEDFSSFVEKIGLSLASEGVFAFSTFEDGNLSQIKTLTEKSLNYYKKEELENILGEKFKVIYSSTEVVDLEFDSAYDVLRHLKQSGVNSLSETKLTRKMLMEFSDKYLELFSKNDKLILTYKPMYFILENV